jgi:accessory sec system protein asp2
MNDNLKTSHILQIGTENWQELINLPQGLGWHYFSNFELPSLQEYMEEQEISKFKALIVDKPEDLLSLKDDIQFFQPYTIFYNQYSRRDILPKEVDYLLRLKQVQAWDFSDKAEFVYLVDRYLNDKQYGDAFGASDIRIRPDFSGVQTVLGKHFLQLDGSYGETFLPLAQWIYNYVYEGSSPVNFWLEYEKVPTCQLQLRLQFFQNGSLGNLIKEVVYSEAQMVDPILIDEEERYYIAFSIEAKGQGRIKLGALHKRFSHGPFGEMSPGAITLRDSKRQEIFAYFHPGDLKPPLNIYFSGYRPDEGFEGFMMMKAMGSPFILFSDPRLEGGSFYLGTHELENKISSYIDQQLHWLGFSSKETNFSGLSMGSFGALYYGAPYSPHAILVGKPLINIGDVAANLKFKRPDDFATSLDIMQLIIGQVSWEGINLLNQRFWDHFNQENLSRTILALAYMRDDDYDQKAYSHLLEALYDYPVRIISSSRPGRHNDATAPIIEWFVTQFKEIMERDFGRIE